MMMMMIMMMMMMMIMMMIMMMMMILLLMIIIIVMNYNDHSNNSVTDIGKACAPVYRWSGRGERRKGSSVFSRSKETRRLPTSDFKVTS